MTDKFNHDEWVKRLVEAGVMSEGAATTPENVQQPDLANRALENAGDGGVEVKYLGSGAYEAEGVSVKRNGQTVSVDEDKAATLVGLQDDEGNALFERV